MNAPSSPRDPGLANADLIEAAFAFGYALGMDRALNIVAENGKRSPFVDVKSAVAAMCSKIVEEEKAPPTFTEARVAAARRQAEGLKT